MGQEVEAHQLSARLRGARDRCCRNGRLRDMTSSVTRCGRVLVTRRGAAVIDSVRPAVRRTRLRSRAVQWLLIAICMAVLAGCGGSAPSAADSPAIEASPRALAGGERLSLASGLTLTVPQDMWGYVKVGDSDGPLEDVGLESEERQLFVNVASYTDEYIQKVGKTWNGWKLVCRSADRSVEVRWLADKELKVSIVGVITRLPGKPTGELLVQSGEEGAPWTRAAARRLATAAWAELSIEGAELPAR